MTCSRDQVSLASYRVVNADVGTPSRPVGGQRRSRQRVRPRDGWRGTPLRATTRRLTARANTRMSTPQSSATIECPSAEITDDKTLITTAASRTAMTTFRADDRRPSGLQAPLSDRRLPLMSTFRPVARGNAACFIAKSTLIFTSLLPNGDIEWSRQGPLPDTGKAPLSRCFIATPSMSHPRLLMLAMSRLCRVCATVVSPRAAPCTKDEQWHGLRV